MSDREFDELVDEMKRSHNTPPEVPADRMWAAIEARRQALSPQVQGPPAREHTPTLLAFLRTPDLQEQQAAARVRDVDHPDDAGEVGHLGHQPRKYVA